jgi:phosphinothricin acetyltransferase
MDGRLRLATPADAPAVRRIYAPYVEETAITFATAVPSHATLETKISNCLPQYPWLVCERDGQVCGYAYAGPLRERDAYQWTVELSVYVAERAQRGGVGRRLYGALLDLLTAQGYASAYGVVTLPNPASVAFHEAFGFEQVGHFDDVGFKQGAWHDVGWWRTRLDDPAAPDPPGPVDEIPAEQVERVLAG